MKKPLLFFTVVLSVLLWSSTASAWDLDGLDPYYFSIVGSGISNPDNQWKDGWTPDANRPKATWDASSGMYVGVIKANSSDIEMKIAFNTGNDLYSSHEQRKPGEWTSAFDSPTGSNMKFTGLTEGQLYRVEIRNSANKPQLRLVSPITAIYLYNKHQVGQQVGVFSNNTLTQSGINPDADNGYGTCRYFIRATHADGSSTDYSIAAKVAEVIENGMTYASLSSGTGWNVFENGYSFCFGTDKDNENIEVTFKVTTDPANAVITSISTRWGNLPEFDEWPTAAWNLESAFRSVYRAPQAGDKLYFYLSTTQNDNRVSPEWMLLPKNPSSPRDGEFLLEDFMVIPNANFRIREFTYVSSNNHTYRDLKNASGAAEFGKAQFGISGQLSQTDQPTVSIDLSDSGTLSTWQVGYTRMTLSVNDGIPEKHVPLWSSDQYVVIYNGSAAFTHVYCKNDDGTENAPYPGQALTRATPYRFAILDRRYDHVEFNGGSSDFKFTPEIKSDALNLVSSGSDLFGWTGTIPEEVIPAQEGQQMTAALLLDKPSTLTEAPVQGMPYLTLYGSNLRPRLGSGQKLSYVLDLNSGASDNSAFTNAYLQYDAEGNLLRYGDNITSAYYVQGENGNDDDIDSHGHPAKGKVMNSTIQPPRNLMYFRLQKGDKYYDLTSRTTQFTYDTVVSDEETASANEGMTGDWRLQPTYQGSTAKEGTKYARYYLENFNMLGDYKIMSGYGSHSYATVVNGLSLYTNWGVGHDSGTYGNQTVESGTVYPLSGAGPIFDENDVATKELGEDNAAGMYIGFPAREYVSKAYFYYGIDHDNIWSTNFHHYHNHNDALVTGNNGRNASWIMFGYKGSMAEITLSKVGADKAEMTWSVGSSGGSTTEKDQINEYKVELFKADSEGKPVKDSQPVYTYGPVTFDTPQDAIPSTTQMAMKDGAEMALEGGRYVAQLTYSGKLVIDEREPKEATRTVLSTVIPVYVIDSKPSLEAAQVTKTYTIEGVEGVSEGTEYTFDALIHSNLSAYIANILRNDPSFDVAAGADFTVTLTVPRHPWQTVTVETADGSFTDNYNMATTEDGDRVILTLGKYFLNEDDNYRLPDVRVYDFVPGKSYDVTLTVTHANNDDLKATASASFFIQAPAGALYGNLKAVPTLNDGEWTGPYWAGSDGYKSQVNEDFNYVALDQGGIRLGSAERLASATAAKWKALYDLTLESNGETSSLTPTAIPAEAASTDKKVGINVDYLAYCPEAEVDAKGVETRTPKPIDYRFTVNTNYEYAAPQSSWRNYTSDITDNPQVTTITFNADLNAPRNGLSDLQTPSAEKEMAKDWVRVKYNWEERYSGAFSVIEDAYVAAEVTEPSYLAFKFDHNRQSIIHNSKSVFHKDNHLKGADDIDDDNHIKPHPSAPGLRLPTYSKDWLENNQKDNIYWFSQGRTDAPIDFEERTYFGASDVHNVKDDSEQPINQISVFDMIENGTALTPVDGKAAAHEPSPFWAGCGEGIWPVTPNEVQEPEHKRCFNLSRWNQWAWPAPTWGLQGDPLDRLHSFLGYYDRRNHQTRAGWNGGEVFSTNWLNLCVTKKAQVGSDAWTEGDVLSLLDGQNDGVIPNPFSDVAYANDYIKVLGKAVISAAYDFAIECTFFNKIEADACVDFDYSTKKDKLDFGRDFFLGGKFTTGFHFNTYNNEFGQDSHLDPLRNLHGGEGLMRVMLRVPHVNHESWWEPRAGRDRGLQRWEKDYAGRTIKNAAGEEKVVGKNATFEDMLEGLIMVPTQYYAPLEYSFVYDYPFLKTNAFATATVASEDAGESTQTAHAAIKAAASDSDKPELIANHVDISARSTGSIPFTYATTGNGKGTATDVEQIDADTADAGDRFSVRYDRDADAVVVSSSAPLGDIRVVSATGALLRRVTASGQTLVTIPVDGLSNGAYIVSVEGRKGVTFLK